MTGLLFSHQSIYLSDLKCKHLLLCALSYLPNIIHSQTDHQVHQHNRTDEHEDDEEASGDVREGEEIRVITQLGKFMTFREYGFHVKLSDHHNVGFQ